MQNIAVPGVFPFIIAMFLAGGAWRSHMVMKRTGTRKYLASRLLCVVGTFLFLALMVFQILESQGISFR